jgi:hypothetical protein
LTGLPLGPFLWDVRVIDNRAGNPGFLFQEEGYAEG